MQALTFRNFSRDCDRKWDEEERREMERCDGCDKMRPRWAFSILCDSLGICAVCKPNQFEYRMTYRQPAESTVDWL
jgi:hypothetical protein